MRKLVVLAAVVLSGCVSAPRNIDAGWSHSSHPRQGRPFGPSSEEDSLDTVGLRARWDDGTYFTEMGLGYRLRDGGFYGDDFIFESRVGVKLFSK